MSSCSLSLSMVPMHTICYNHNNVCHQYSYPHTTYYELTSLILPAQLSTNLTFYGTTVTSSQVTSATISCYPNVKNITYNRIKCNEVVCVNAGNLNVGGIMVADVVGAVG